MSISGKVRIYKTSKKYAEISNTKQIMPAAEIKNVRSTACGTFKARARSEEIRRKRQIQDVIRWMQISRKWHAQVGRMHDNNLAKILVYGKPLGRRPKLWAESY